MDEVLPRRDDVLGLLGGRARPLTIREMAARLRVSERLFPGFARYIESLAQEGVLRSLAHDHYTVDGPRAEPRALSSSTDLEGVFTVDPRGFARVEAAGARGELRIPAHASGGALHGDRVLARAVRRGPQGPEGEVLRVVARAQQRVGGTLRRRGQSAWLEPDDPRTRGPIVLRGEVSGREGEAAVARITRFPELPDENPEGELVAVLGTAGTLRAEESKMLVRAGLREAHGEAALAEGARQAAEATRARSLDGDELGAVPLVAIEAELPEPGELAVWAERHEDGSSTVWLAVPDVSRHVLPSSALDEEARERGQTCALPDRQVTMLPASLTDALERAPVGEPRASLAIVARLGPDAELLEGRVIEGVATTRARLTTTAVGALLTADEGATSSPELGMALRLADRLAQRWVSRQQRRGVLALGPPGARVTLRDGRPIDVERRDERDPPERARRLLASLASLADEVTTRFLVDRGLAAPFCAQGPPETSRLGPFVGLSEALGAPLAESEAQDPRAVTQHLARLDREPSAALLGELLWRALPEATYDITPSPHYTRATSALARATSPLHRYADLVAQRVLKSALAAEREGARLVQDAAAEERLAEDARLAAEGERRARSVEREALDLHRAFALHEQVGKSYAGVVSEVTGHGVYVTLDAPWAEVLVRSDALGRDLYELDAERQQFRARQTRDSVGLGERVEVTIEEVSIRRRLVQAWRHEPGLADRAPLRHAPFRRPSEARPDGASHARRDEPARGAGPRATGARRGR